LNDPHWNSEIPHFGKNLVGAHQFKRLIEEFRKIIQLTELPKPSESDVVASLGRRGVQDVSPDYVWAACEIATNYASDALEPLVRQFGERGIYILKRQAVVARRIISKKETHSYGGSHFFHSFVRQLFETYADKMVDLYQENCFQEFLNVATIYWDFSRTTSKLQKEQVAETAVNFFNSIKQRISRKAVLMLCNFFIFSITEKLYGWDTMQSEVHVLSDQQLQDLFQSSEIAATLQKDEDALKQVLRSYEDQEYVLFGGDLFAQKDFNLVY